MATDDEAYKTFGDLFGPIIKDLHPKFDYRFSYKHEELRPEVIDEEIHRMRTSIEKVTDFKITIGRNFASPFAPLMTQEAKL